MKHISNLQYLYILCLSVCLFFFVTDKRKNGLADRAQILCGPHKTTVKFYESVRLGRGGKSPDMNHYILEIKDFRP